jgi:hypothetical protein
MSALTPKADIQLRRNDGRYGPKADMARCPCHVRFAPKANAPQRQSVSVSGNHGHRAGSFWRSLIVIFSGVHPSALDVAISAWSDNFPYSLCSDTAAELVERGARLRGVNFRDINGRCGGLILGECNFNRRDLHCKKCDCDS